jgi:uncharacterized membrane protein YphA (DoxX/SURF4 family)
MGLLYLTGFILFVAGILVLNDLLLKAGAAILLTSAIFYVINVVKTYFIKSKNNGGIK